jgi:hydrogenase-4 component E
MELFIILGLLASAYAMASSKRISALIGNFRLQAFFLCLITLMEAYKSTSIRLYIVTLLLLVLKVVVIPMMLVKIAKEIKVNEDLGFIVNPQLSLIFAAVLTYFSWVFASKLFVGQETILMVHAAVAFNIIGMGAYLMIFRMKALAQIVGLLSMENGIFLLASLAGGMPFIVEMTVFFDVFVSVIILGIFVYRINRLFVSIDVSKLNRLKG